MKKLSFAFRRENYLLIIGGLVVVVLGFILMSGGGSDDPEVFSEAIFSTRRITIAPLTVLLGYGIIGYGIMKKPAKRSENEAA